MKLRRTAALTGVVLTTAVVLAACGSDDGGSPSGPKGDPIKIGSVITATGPAAGSSASADEILKAWADDVNASGGLNGHRIELTVKDDGGSPEKALQDAKDLIENEKVVALVGSVSGATSAFQKYVEEKRVPVIGGFPTEAPFSSSPMFFINGAGPAVTAVGQYQQVAQAGLKKAGLLYCSEFEVCANADKLGKAVAPMLKVGYVSAAISASAPNYTAQCLKFKEDGVDALFVAHTAAVLPRVAADCAAANYHPTYVGSATTFGPALLTDKNFQGSIWNGTNANYLDTSVPAVKRLHDALEKYSPKTLKSDEFTPVAANAFWSGLLFEAASKAAGGFTPQSTSADIIAAMYKLHDVTLDGAAPPLTFVEGKPGFPTCFFEMDLKDEKLVSKNDNKPTCLPDAMVAGLKKMLGQ